MPMMGSKLNSTCEVDMNAIYSIYAQKHIGKNIMFTNIVWSEKKRKWVDHNKNMRFYNFYYDLLIFLMNFITK
jgi:hypothetical protein